MYIGPISTGYINTLIPSGKRTANETWSSGWGSPIPSETSIPSYINLALGGTIVKDSTFTRDIETQLEELLALESLDASYGYINTTDMVGFVDVSSARLPATAGSRVRPFNIQSRFYSQAQYQRRYNGVPLIINNDFSRTLFSDGCDVYSPIPVGATYLGGDDSTISMIGADGTMTAVKSNIVSEIWFDLAATEYTVGECKVWDSITPGDTNSANWVRTSYLDHSFTGDVIIDNSLTRLTLSLNDLTRQISTYIVDTWVDTGTDELYEQNITDYNLKLSTLHIITLTPDMIKVRGEVYASGFTSTKIVVEWTLSRGNYLIHRKIIGASAPRHDLNFTFDKGWDGVDIADVVLGVGTSGNTSQYTMGIDETNNCIGIISKATTASIVIASDGTKQSVLDSVESDIGFIPFPNAINLSKECEAMTQGSGVSFYTGTDARPGTGNTGSVLDAVTEYVEYTFTAGTDIPLGTFRILVRAKDTNHNQGDMVVTVDNTTDATDCKD